MIIGLMVSIVVAVTLIPTITQSIESIPKDETTPTAVTGLLSVLPYIMVAVILIGAVAWIGGNSGQSSPSEVTISLKNSKDYILSLLEQSKRLEIYLNNLDLVLGVSTVKSTTYSNEEGLYLDNNNNLMVDTKNYQWIVLDKHPNQNIFKVVGLHDNDSTKNKAFILGNLDKPFLIPLSNSYIDNPNWTKIPELTTSLL